MSPLKYNDQLQLLVKTLPYIDWEKFSLKGGTAINLFYRQLPRISVDIDLTYRCISGRDAAIKDIHAGMKSMCDRVNTESSFRAVPHTGTMTGNDPVITKVFVHAGSAEIKIEPNFILRGSVYDDASKTIAPGVSEILNISPDLSATVMSFEDVFAGKICAALNRQHPRDLFDVRLLLEQEGISSKTRDAFLVYLCCNNRSVSELLNPNRIYTKDLLESQFAGMAATPFDYPDYEKTRTDLIRSVRRALTDKDRKFLLSFSEGRPQWDLLGADADSDRIKSLPGIQWKLLNIGRMNPGRKSKELENINAIFADANNNAGQQPSPRMIDFA
ncbi:MAG: nucleotidyl transferase AbiEii/AbiGii toxin family protein [Chitinispirillaceae bacterium]|nr:nucleotidyl transferase AbiEii/AbiGii toxin family protein [Chitinispirillaceae bacterium]